MKSLLSLILSFLLMPQLGWAEFQYIPYQTIRDDAQEDASVPAIGQVIRVKAQSIPGEGHRRSAYPTHLTRDQEKEFLRRLKQAEERGGPRIAPEQRQRLLDGIARIDINYTDPILSKNWDPILSAVSDLIEKEHAEPNADWDAIVVHSMKKAVQMLKDPHSGYLNAEEFRDLQDEFSGSFVGIGAQIAPYPEPPVVKDEKDVEGIMAIEEAMAGKNSKGVKIKTVFEDSGAQAAGLQEGDIIVWLKGPDDAAGHSLAAMPITDIVKQLRGKENSVVSVKVLREGRESEEIPVTRHSVQNPNVFSKLVGKDKKIGYVYFSEFRESGDKCWRRHGSHCDNSSDELVFAAIRSLRAQGAKSLILDIRFNPGGNVDTVTSIASEFLKDKQDIVSFKHQGLLDEKYVADGDGKFSDMPVVALINEASASASEILSGALQDYNPGSIIGARSYGKGSEQAIIPDGSGALRITINRWYTPKGKNINGKLDENGLEIPGTGGIVPDIGIDVPKEQMRNIFKEIRLQLNKKPLPSTPTADPVLDKAIEVLSAENPA